MQLLGLFVVLGTLVTNSLGQDCPPEPEIPPDFVTQPAGSIRQEKRDEMIMWDDWFADIEKRSVRSSDKEPVTSATGGGRTKRQTFRCRIQRKEYRQMTETEINRWHRCLKRMKENGTYDLLASYHKSSLAPGAHGGVAFLPWHRIYLWEFEWRMRQLPGCRRAFIPYWDSALDKLLPVHTDSVLWDADFWGTNTGMVTEGIGAWWKIPDDCTGRGVNLTRIIMGTDGRLYDREEILSVQPAKTFFDFVTRKFEGQPIPEGIHGSQHCYFGCGGGSHVGSLKCAPHDAVFYMIHSMVDYIWHEWQELPGRNNSYPIPGRDNVTLAQMARRGDPRDHLGGRPMRPFIDPRNDRSFRNRDGMRRRFHCPYTVRPSRDNCLLDENCKSPMGLLYCRSDCQCSSKVKEGGRCDQLPDRACYCAEGRGSPRCRQNRCECR